MEEPLKNTSQNKNISIAQVNCSVKKENTTEVIGGKFSVSKISTRQIRTEATVG